MKKQITITILGMMMLSGAMAMYAGNTISFETNLTNPVYTVTGNTSSLEGLNVTFDGGNINVTPALNYRPDNFTIIFLDNLTKEVIKVIHIGGGSRRIEYIDNNVTVYVPEYINTTEIVEVEVERIVDNTTTIEIEYKLWMVLTAMITGFIFCWFIIKKPKEKKK